MRQVQAGAGCFVLLLALGPRTVLACSPRPDIAAVIWPEEGEQGVPTNARLFLNFRRTVPDLSTEVFLRVGPSTVAATLVDGWQDNVLYSFPIPNYPFAALEEWAPSAELSPNTTYTLVVVTARSGAFVERVESSFETGAGPYAEPFGPPIEVSTYYQRDPNGPSFFDSCSSDKVDELTQCSLVVPPSRLGMVMVATPEVPTGANFVDVPKATYIVPRPLSQWTRVGFFGVSNGPLCYRLTIIDGVGRREESRHCDVDACALGWDAFRWSPDEWENASTPPCSSVLPSLDGGIEADAGTVHDAGPDAGPLDATGGADTGGPVLVEDSGCGCSAAPINPRSAQPFYPLGLALLIGAGRIVRRRQASTST